MTRAAVEFISNVQLFFTAIYLNYRGTQKSSVTTMVRLAAIFRAAVGVPAAVAAESVCGNFPAPIQLMFRAGVGFYTPGTLAQCHLKRCMMHWRQKNHVKISAPSAASSRTFMAAAVTLVCGNAGVVPRAIGVANAGSAASVQHVVILRGSDGVPRESPMIRKAHLQWSAGYAIFFMCGSAIRCCSVTRASRRQVSGSGSKWFKPVPLVVLGQQR